MVFTRKDGGFSMAMLVSGRVAIGQVRAHPSPQPSFSTTDHWTPQRDFAPCSGPQTAPWNGKTGPKFHQQKTMGISRVFFSFFFLIRFFCFFLDRFFIFFFFVCFCVFFVQLLLFRFYFSHFWAFCCFHFHFEIISTAYFLAFPARVFRAFSLNIAESWISTGSTEKSPLPKGIMCFYPSTSTLKHHKKQVEPRKKKKLLLSIESWLVKRDPFNIF